MRGRSWLVWAGLGGVSLAAFLGLVAFVFWDAASTALSPSRSTDTASTAFHGDAEKVAFLGKYLKLPVPVETAEFRVVFHDNGLAPSDWHIVAALKLAPRDVSRFTHGMSLDANDVSDFAWGEALVAHEPRFRHRSTPKRFSRGGCRVVAFEAEGVLFEKCTTLQAP